MTQMHHIPLVLFLGSFSIVHAFRPSNNLRTIEHIGKFHREKWIHRIDNHRQTKLLFLEVYNSRIPRHNQLRPLQASSDWNDETDDFVLPESSFGSEVVPEGQRPVNEYINLMQQPLFDWASEKTGTLGLLIRLALVYVISLVAV